MFYFQWVHDQSGACKRIYFCNKVLCERASVCYNSLYHRKATRCADGSAHKQVSTHVYRRNIRVRFSAAAASLLVLKQAHQADVPMPAEAYWED